MPNIKYFKGELIFHLVTQAHTITPSAAVFHVSSPHPLHGDQRTPPSLTPWGAHRLSEPRWPKGYLLSVIPYAFVLYLVAAISTK